MAYFAKGAKTNLDEEEGRIDEEESMKEKDQNQDVESRIDEEESRKEKDQNQELIQSRTTCKIDLLAEAVKETKSKLDAEGDKKEETQNQELPEESPIFRRDSSFRGRRTFREVVKTVYVSTLTRVDRFISENGVMPSHDENWWRERLLKKPIVNSDIEKSINEKEGKRISNGIVIKEGLLTESMESSDESDEEFYNVEEGTSSSRVFKRQRSLEKEDEEFSKVKKSKQNKREEEVADDGLKKQRKKTVAHEGPYPPPKLSIEVKNLIAEKVKEKEGFLDNEGEILVIQKILRKSDIERQQNRFSIPRNKMKNKFLNNEEEAKIHKQGNNMTVDIIEPSCKVKEVNLTRWNVGTSSKLYILNGEWQNIVRHNQLRQGDIVQLWAVRINGRLCFVFVILAKEEGSTSIASQRD